MDKNRDKPLNEQMRDLADLAKAELKRRGIDVEKLSPSERKALAAKLDNGEK